jgi:hypothetical protein
MRGIVIHLDKTIEWSSQKSFKASKQQKHLKYVKTSIYYVLGKSKSNNCYYKTEYSIEIHVFHLLQTLL